MGDVDGRRKFPGPLWGDRDVPAIDAIHADGHARLNELHLAAVEELAEIETEIVEGKVEKAVTTKRLLDHDSVRLAVPRDPFHPRVGEHRRRLTSTPYRLALSALAAADTAINRLAFRILREDGTAVWLIAVAQAVGILFVAHKLVEYLPGRGRQRRQGWLGLVWLSALLVGILGATSLRSAYLGAVEVPTQYWPALGLQVFLAVAAVVVNDLHLNDDADAHEERQDLLDDVGEAASADARAGLARLDVVRRTVAAATGVIEETNALRAVYLRHNLQARTGPEATAVLADIPKFVVPEWYRHWSDWLSINEFVEPAVDLPW